MKIPIIFVMLVLKNNSLLTFEEIAKRNILGNVRKKTQDTHMDVL